MADDTLAQDHKELAAFHTYELGRTYDPQRPEWFADGAGQRRTEYRYLIQLAHRRSQAACVLTCIERIAASLAIADGEQWPACDRKAGSLPDSARAARAAATRQRYRHLARIVHAETMNYYELGTDDELYRQHVIEEAKRQMAEDKRIVSEQRQAIGIPPGVSFPESTR
jgi:hypothetical protein